MTDGEQAAVLGAARAVGALEPEGVEAHFIVAACEVSDFEAILCHFLERLFHFIYLSFLRI